MTWQRSTYCETGTCVEVWRSACDNSSGNCVEVDTGDVVRVRDGKLVDSPVLTFDHQEWAVFVKGVKAGEFDVEVTS